ncbi:MAG: binding-protein-dependent transport system inner rane component, partial [Firmicutes bacterium]|nr:binding-protein-dependent transport system inner rane component [Bacillota bacterium]
GFTFANYLKFFREQPYPEVLYLTFKLALTVTVACLLLGYPVAYLLATVSSRARGILMLFVLLPFFTSLLVRTYAWMAILQKTGVINSLLQKMGLIQEPIKMMFNTVGVTIGMVHVLLPFMILPLYSGMSAIDLDLLKAASSLGARPATAFLRVFVPLSVPGIAAGSLMVFIMALGFYITPELLGGPRDYTMSRLIAVTIGQQLNWNFASAQAGILFAVTVIVMVIYQRVLGLERM